MKLLSITQSHNPDKKLDAKFETERGTKTVSFGAKGMDDYTKTHDDAQKERYRTRHAKDLNTGDPTRPGYLSWWLLWNKPTLGQSIADYKRRFKL